MIELRRLEIACWDGMLAPTYTSSCRGVCQCGRHLPRLSAGTRCGAASRSPVEVSGTKLRGSGGGVDFAYKASSGRTALTAHIDGKLLADTLTLFVKLLFISAGTTQHQLVPKLSGSILLETPPHKIQLEGDGARFPIEVIDFTTTNFPHQAGWYLSWDPDDLEQPLLGDVRLYINSRHPQIAAAVSDIRPETAGIREAIRLDLAQTLIRGVLLNPSFLENPDRYSPGHGWRSGESHDSLVL